MLPVGVTFFVCFFSVLELRFVLVYFLKASALHFAFSLLCLVFTKHRAGHRKVASELF